MSISVLNTDAAMSGKTIKLLESDQTTTGLETFSRGSNAPFAVASSSAAVVTNLDADKLDGQEGTYYEPGAWTSPSFSAGNFTASSGNWTVAAGDVTTYAYRKSGRTITVAFWIVTTTVSTTPAELRLAIPGGFTAAKSMLTVGDSIDNGTRRSALVFVDSGETHITIARQDGSAWTAATDNTNVYGTITFETTA